MAIEAVSLPFREQAEFFRRKLNMPTEAWTDVYAQQQNYSFMVAGANRNDLVADFRAAVDKAITDGGTLEDFRRDFDEIVARYGWSYNGGRNWRSRVIFETNLNTTYMAGRYEQLMAVREDRPYWQYLHSDAVEEPRPLHEGWDGMVLRWDDPWWQYHFPTNGWGCQCRVIALSDSDLQRMGKDGPDTAPPIEWEERVIGQRSPGGPMTVRVPRGVDPGFEYVPGRSRLNGGMPPPGGGGGTSPPGTTPGTMPAPRAVEPSQLLPSDAPDDSVINALLAEFGAVEQPIIFRDPTGEALALGQQLFMDSQSRELRPPLPERRSLVNLLAQTIRSPDEIWTRLAWFPGASKASVRRQYISRFTLPGEGQPTTVAFETGKDGWRADALADPQAYRQGERVYQRGAD